MNRFGGKAITPTEPGFALIKVVGQQWRRPSLRQKPASSMILAAPGKKMPRLGTAGAREVLCELAKRAGSVIDPRRDQTKLVDPHH